MPGMTPAATFHTRKLNGETNLQASRVFRGVERPACRKRHKSGGLAYKIPPLPGDGSPRERGGFQTRFLLTFRWNWYKVKLRSNTSQVRLSVLYSSSFTRRDPDIEFSVISAVKEFAHNGTGNSKVV
jgi:hypothetical protein